MENAYAQALWKMVAEGMSPSKAVHALRDLLDRDGREALLPRIGKAFARIAEREAHKNDIILTVAREHDAPRAKKEAKEALSALGLESSDLPADEAGLKTRVDDSLIGGWRLEGKEHLVDASYKHQLLELYNRAVSA